nr:protein C1orf43 homolog [Lytechinus pictus]
MAGKLSPVLPTTLILIAGFGGLFLLMVMLFAKRQITRFKFRSRRTPHTAVGHGAPKRLQLEIEHLVQRTQQIKGFPTLLADDDYRLQYLANTESDRCTYVYRMKAVDAFIHFEEQVKKLDGRLSRPIGVSVREHIKQLKVSPLTPLKGASDALCRAYIDAYEHARFGCKPFGEAEYNNYMALLHELINCLRHKSHKKRKVSQATHPSQGPTRSSIGSQLSQVSGPSPNQDNTSSNNRTTSSLGSIHRHVKPQQLSPKSTADETSRLTDGSSSQSQTIYDGSTERIHLLRNPDRLHYARKDTT